MGAVSKWHCLQFVSGCVPWYLMVVTVLLHPNSIRHYFLSHVLVSLPSTECVAPTGRDVGGCLQCKPRNKPLLVGFHFCVQVIRYGPFLSRVQGYLALWSYGWYASGSLTQSLVTSFKHSYCYTYHSHWPKKKTAFCLQCVFLCSLWPQTSL